MSKVDEQEPERVGVSDSGYPVYEGERYAKSPVTDNTYVVTKWEDRGDGRMVAKRKTEIDPEDIPDEVDFDV